MNKEQIEQMLDQTGLEYWYRNTGSQEVSKLPYLLWHIPKSRNIRADGVVYHKTYRLNIELCTGEKDFNSEQMLEDVFDLYNLTYDKTETFLDDKAMYKILYEMEI